MLAFASLVLLLACNDHVRVVNFEADPAGTFVFTAQTNTVMTENDDGEAEQIRRDWRAGVAQIGALATGIGADHDEIGTGALVFVGNAGRDHDDVAGVQLYRCTALAAEPHANRSGRDPEHLVRGAVIMVVGVNPVAPG